MLRKNVNLTGINFLIADSDLYCCKIAQSILRSFGAASIIEAYNAKSAQKIMIENRIDVLLCDADIPPIGGDVLVRAIRRDKTHPCRSIPIMIMSRDARLDTINKARNAGAHMVVAKPLSPTGLYSRLAWIAFHSRNFFESDKYFGPDRRMKVDGYTAGIGRRQGDMSQSEIDSLLAAANGGQFHG